MRKQITQAASVVKASWITPSRSSRDRNRRRTFSQLIVRPTAHRTFAAVWRLPLGGVRLDPQPPEGLDYNSSPQPPLRRHLQRS
jgi:hypothetical protein